MNSIIAQIKLDNTRIQSYGRLNGILALIYIPVILSALMASLGPKTSDFGSGTLASLGGSMVFVTIIFCTSPFSITEQSGDARMDGMIPISRRNQVLGRYCIIGIGALAYTLSMLLSVLVVKLAGMPIGLPIMPTIGFCFLLLILLTDLVVPFMYRFSPASMMKGMSLSFAAVVVIAVLVSHIDWDWMSIYLRISDFITSSAARTITIAVLAAFAATAVSLACSLKVFGKKEL